MKKKYIIQYNELSDNGYIMGYRNDKGDYVSKYHYFDSHSEALETLSICKGGNGHFEIKEVYV